MEGFLEDVEKMAQFMVEKGGGDREAAYQVALDIEADCTGDSPEEFIKGFFFGQVALYIRKTHLLN